MTPFQKEAKSITTELSPRKVYPFTFKQDKVVVVFFVVVVVFFCLFFFYYFFFFFFVLFFVVFFYLKVDPM